MRRKYLTLVILVVLAAIPSSALAGDKQPDPGKQPAHRVVATYFHGNVRCATCRKIEAYSKEAVAAGFPKEMEGGIVVFQAINTDQKENQHYVQDYKLMMKSLIIADEKDGKVVAWVNLPKIWTLTGNQDEFMAYVREAVQVYLDAK